MLRQVSLLSTLLTFACLFYNARARIGAISIFRGDESIYHKYSAVLAAIDPFRSQLREDIKRTLGPLSKFFHGIRGTNLEDPSNGIATDNRDAEVAYSKYEKKINDIIRSYDMSVGTFNELSESIQEEPSLKRKVLRQAYLYRVAADLEKNMKKLPTLHTSGAKSISSKSIGGGAGRKKKNSRPQGSSDVSENDTEAEGSSVSVSSSGFSSQSGDADIDGESEFSRFCRALRSIEKERVRIRERLQNDLGVRNLPAHMSDPDMKPVMCKQVQSAVEKFPNLVDKIIDFYGVPEDDFDRLYEKAIKSPFYRFRVEREMSKIEKQASRDD